jgi:hypothetical protein
MTKRLLCFCEARRKIWEAAAAMGHFWRNFISGVIFASDVIFASGVFIRACGKGSYACRAP